MLKMTLISLMKLMNLEYNKIQQYKQMVLKKKTLLQAKVCLLVRKTQLSIVIKMTLNSNLKQRLYNLNLTIQNHKSQNTRHYLIHSSKKAFKEVEVEHMMVQQNRITNNCSIFQPQNIHSLNPQLRTWLIVMEQQAKI